MRREYKVLSRLWSSYPPAPRALHLCTDHDVVGSDFIVVEYRPGEVIWDHLTPSMAGLPGVGERLGRAVVSALGELHLLDPVACGLGDLGRPEGFVRRQLDGWQTRWNLVAPVGRASLLSDVATALGRSVPEPQRVSFVHNDYKLSNCQFTPGEPDRVHSVFDWDMATCGDPLIDVGTLLNYWPDPSDTLEDRPLILDGMSTLGLPSRAEILTTYHETTGLDVSGIRWYEGFACFKAAVVLRQLARRYEVGESADPRMVERGRGVEPMARRAARILSLASPDAAQKDLG
jgi:aminoglycoside phosphotransferase (APT) family kinase protein